MKSDILIYSNEAVLLCDGIFNTILNYKDLGNSIVLSNIRDIDENLSLSKSSVLIYSILLCDKSHLDTIQELLEKYHKLKVLLIGQNFDKDFVFESIKRGVKGLLTLKSSQSELREAIMALKNGYDFFSNVLTSYLVKDHMNKLNSKNKNMNKEILNLSIREIEILKLWGNSYGNKEIADKLCISVRTVESHKNHIMQKLNLKTTVDLLKFAIKNSLVSLD